MCEKHNIPAVIKSPDVKSGDSCSVQSDIGSFLVTTPQLPPWNREGLLSHVCEWVVLDNQSFSVVEKESFKALLHYQRPSMIPRDLPSRTTVTDEIYAKSLHVKGLLTEKFRVLDSLVSFTFDAGTSRALDPYLTVTGQESRSGPQRSPSLSPASMDR
jgi:hypothetical protein